MAYKCYNFEYIDMIWLEKEGLAYNIFYKRDEKHRYIHGGIDDEKGKGFFIMGSPNPFTEQININVIAEDPDQRPIIEIYSTDSRLVKVLIPDGFNGNAYSFVWDGTDNSGVSSPEGMYIILCTVEKQRVARKVIRTF